MYELHPTNFAACNLLGWDWQGQTDYSNREIKKAQEQLDDRSKSLSVSARSKLLEQYANPVIRKSHEKTNLDITAIDNLPSMLPFESSEDFSNQLLPTLLELKNIDKGPWGRAKQIYLGNI